MRRLTAPVATAKTRNATGTAIAQHRDMPVRLSTLVEADAESDGAAFDFSDADDVDIVSSSAPLQEEPCASPRSPERRADQAEDVLASCALWEIGRAHV